MEIDRSELYLYSGELGRGAFGVVKKGKWRGRDVAVKMSRDVNEQSDVFKEAKVMTRFNHPNLVKIYGMCTKSLPILIVLEFMEKGSLLCFLKKNEYALKREFLVNICIQVCRGMEYLESENYFHRDLAARNCLVGAQHEIKVADFGLTRDDLYEGHTTSIFPIRWSPLEVIDNKDFSIKSDMWAYGVLMWETFTYGKVPYGSATNSEVIRKLRQGCTLDKPEKCYEGIWEIMKQCWNFRPAGRPSFKQLRTSLENFSPESEPESSEDSSCIIV